MKVETRREITDNVKICKLVFTSKIEDDGYVIIPTPTEFYPDVTLAYICNQYVIYRLDPLKHHGDCVYPTVFEYELIKKGAPHEDINPANSLPRNIFKKPGKT